MKTRTKVKGRVRTRTRTIWRYWKCNQNRLSWIMRL